MREVERPVEWVDRPGAAHRNWARRRLFGAERLARTQGERLERRALGSAIDRGDDIARPRLLANHPDRHPGDHIARREGGGDRPGEILAQAVRDRGGEGVVVAHPPKMGGCEGRAIPSPIRVG